MFKKSIKKGFIFFATNLAVSGFSVLKNNLKAKRYLRLGLILTISISLGGIIFIAKQVLAGPSFGAINLVSVTRSTGNTYIALGTWGPQGGQTGNYKIQIREGGSVLAEANPAPTQGSQPFNWSLSFSLPSGGHRVCAFLIHSKDGGQDQNTSDCVDQASGGGTISGYKYETLVNPYTDPDKTPGSGWTIFLDQNQNGILDSGELSTVTAADGYYSFSDLVAGIYYIVEQLKANWSQLVNPNPVTIDTGTISTGNNLVNLYQECTNDDTRACEGNNTGVCSSGTQTCSGGHWGQCTGVVGSSTELCDNLDNDCDGTVDNGFDVGASCSAGVGTCAAGGFKVCAQDQTSTVCNAVPGTPALTDLCIDGLDNNCNGSVDEACQCNSGSTQSCGLTDVGECQLGIKTCADGLWGQCTGAIGSSDETCDGKDNDCDGETDEGYNVGASCSVGIGSCAISGTYVCATDGQQAVCSVSAGQGSEEVCDGLDNDCDGEVDNSLIAPSQSCSVGLGICATSGTQTKVCLGTAGWSESYGECSATAGQGSEEVCDGLDNNCDGEVDNYLIAPSQSCSVGLGVCQASGTQLKSCLGTDGWSQSFGTCSASAGEPTSEVEICDDQLDNNCDGYVDEGCGGEISYNWLAGGWGSCSADCGGGTQSRPITCQSSDQQTVNDEFCYGTKPVASQACNEQSCGGGGGGGGGGFTPSPCFSVEYYDWQTICVNGLQFRDIKAVVPEGCAITQAQRDAAQRACSGTGGQVLGTKITADDICSETQYFTTNDVQPLLAYMQSKRNLSDEQRALAKYIKPLLNKAKDKSLTAAQIGAMTNYVVYSGKYSLILGQGERAGVLNSFKRAFGRLPKNENEWCDVLRIATGIPTNEKNAAAENIAKNNFKKYLGLDISPADSTQNNEFLMAAYGLRPSPRILTKETTAAMELKKQYKGSPANTEHWDFLRSLAYFLLNLKQTISN